MKRAPLTYRRRPWPPQKLARRNERAEALAKTDLPADEAKKWQRDRRDARKILKPPADKWQ